MDTGNMALSSRQDWQMYLPRLLMTADSMTDKFKEIGDVENGARREAENESAPNNQMASLGPWPCILLAISFSLSVFWSVPKAHEHVLE